MNNQKRLEALDKLQELYQRYEEQENAFCELIPDFFHCGLVSSHNAIVDFLIDQFAERWDIPWEELNWHIYENGWGSRGFVCCLATGERIKVMGNEDFLRTA